MVPPGLAAAGSVGVSLSTGLTGGYDIKLKMPPQSAANGAQDPGPSIFTVQEQLGLKLESAKGSVETLVIVERPPALQINRHPITSGYVDRQQEQLFPLDPDRLKAFLRRSFQVSGDAVRRLSRQPSTSGLRR
jgi:hypothetical protein